MKDIWNRAVHTQQHNAEYTAPRMFWGRGGGSPPTNHNEVVILNQHHSVPPTIQTPPPASRPGQFEEAVFHPPYHPQPQQFTYDMSKQAVASARMPGGPVAPPSQTGYIPARQAQQQPQYYVDTAQESMWPQQAQYFVTSQQTIRSRMPNSQLNNPIYMGGMPGVPFPMTPGQIPFNQQGIQIVQQPGQQYMYQQRYQIPQQQQMGYMAAQFGPQGGGGYSQIGQNMYFPPPTMQHIPAHNPNRPPSAGPAGPMTQSQPPRRERKALAIVNPATGLDVTVDILATSDRPSSRESQPESTQQSQIAAEFAAKVAERLQGHPEGSMASQMEGAAAHHEVPPPLVIQQPTGEVQQSQAESPTMVSPEMAAKQLEEEEEQQHFQVMNGEAEPSIRPADIGPSPPHPAPVPVSAPAKTDSDLSSVKYTQRAAASEPVFEPPPPAHTSQPTPAAPKMPEPASATEDTLVKEPSPPAVPVTTAPEAVPEKEASPVETQRESEPQSPSVDISVSSSVAASATPSSSPAQAPQSPTSTAAQNQPGKDATDSRPGPKDGRKAGKRNKKDLNKRGESKEGTDMDAFYDASEQKTSPEEPQTPPPAETPSPIPAPPTVTPPSPTTKVEEPGLPQEAAPEAKSAEPEPKTEAEKPAQKQDGLLPTPTMETLSPESAEDQVNGVVEDDADEPVSAEEKEVPGTEKKSSLNGLTLKYTYKEDQWSPLNPEGKRQYDRDFLLQLQSDPGSNQRPMNLPDLPDIILDRPAAMKNPLAMMGKAFPDFTPGFFVKANQGRSGGQGSMSKRGSQQGRRGGPGSMMGEQRVIKITSLSQDIQLHKSENAYKIGARVEGASKEEVENEKLYRNFKAILNKLTPQKFSTLVQQALSLEINTEERIRKVTDLIFEKALSEPNFSVAYANMCKSLLSLPKVPSESDPNTFIQFRAILLTKCQKEFESDASTELDLEARREEADATTDEVKKAELLAEIAEADRQARRRSTGNIRFIGELFKLRMLTENIMHDCIFKLLKARDEESLECLCRLITTIGKELDTPKAKVAQPPPPPPPKNAWKKKLDASLKSSKNRPDEEVPRMDQYFQQMHKLADMKELPSRVRFMIQDVLELREKFNWVPRRNENKPKTIDQIHKEAAQEKVQQQLLMSTPLSKPEPSPGGRGGAGKGGKGGRGSMGGVEADPGWNTVQTRAMRQIDASRMKLSRQNVDETIQLGPGGGSKFSNWHMGSKGGGSRSQEQEKPAGNRYSLLNNMGEGDGRRSFGRSPARGDSGSRGAGRMSDRRDRDGREPGGFGRGRMVARSSQEGERSERERAIASARNLLGAGAQGGSSNPSSRDASRDNSRSREAKAEPAAAPASGPDASLMSQDYIDNKIKNIVEEFLHNLDFKEATDCVAEWRNLNHKELVTTMVNTVLERSSQARLHVGELLFHLINHRIINVKNLTDGLMDVMEFAEDMEIDVPKIFEYLGELCGPMILDNSVLPLSFLRSAVEPLIQSGNGKAAPLLAQALHVACQRKPHSHVRAQFREGGLQVADFVPAEKVNDFIKQRELDWLVQESEGATPASPAVTRHPPGWVEDKLTSLLQTRGVDNERIFDFIEANVSEEDQRSHQFIRELITAVCRSAISGDNASTYKVNVPAIQQRRSLLLKYLENNPELELQALYALQHLMCNMEHPPGILKALFDVLYDEEIISEESFYAWKDGDHPTEQKGRGVALLSANAFYAWLKEGEES